MTEDEQSSSKLTDEEFLAGLRQRYPEQGWTVGDLIEVERRGFNILDDDLEIKEDMQLATEKMMKSLRAAIAPQIESFKKLSKSLMKPIFPDLARISSLHPEIMNMEITSPQVKQLAVQQEMLDVQTESLLVLQGIKLSQKKTWFDWSLWIFAGIAMIASLLSII